MDDSCSECRDTFSYNIKEMMILIKVSEVGLTR